MNVSDTGYKSSTPDSTLKTNNHTKTTTKCSTLLRHWLGALNSPPQRHQLCPTPSGHQDSPQTIQPSQVITNQKENDIKHSFKFDLTLNGDYTVAEYLSAVADRKPRKSLTMYRLSGHGHSHRAVTGDPGYPEKPGCVHSVPRTEWTDTVTLAAKYIDLFHAIRDAIRFSEWIHC